MSEEEIIEENIKRYIKKHSRTIKAYTQEYVDKLQSQLQQKESIIKEIKEYNKKIIKEGWYGGFEKENAKHNLEILEKGE